MIGSKKARKRNMQELKQWRAVHQLPPNEECSPEQIKAVLDGLDKLFYRAENYQQVLMRIAVEEDASEAALRLRSVRKWCRDVLAQEMTAKLGGAAGRASRFFESGDTSVLLEGLPSDGARD